MGLGSEAMLGLSVARVLAWVNDLPDGELSRFTDALDLGPAARLNVAGFQAGGLLLVDPESPLETPPRRRLEISHAERDAWAYVFCFPHPPDDVPDNLETDRLERLTEAAANMSETQPLLDGIWQAVEDDDIQAFGQSLMALQASNHSALEATGHSPALDEAEQAICDLMRQNGAVAWGRSLSGYALFALIKGAKASIDLRQTLRQHVGYFGGTIIATITDQSGRAPYHQRGTPGHQSASLLSIA